MTLEQHPSLLSSGAENCFSFLVPRKLDEASPVVLNTVAQVQQDSERDMATTTTAADEGLEFSSIQRKVSLT